MTEDKSYKIEEAQRKFAVDLFNLTWDLMDKSDRSPTEDARMVHAAHASRYHWGEIGTPLNFARGDWQLSRVYAVLGQGEQAVNYAKSSLELCQEHGYGDFDLAFAYEALARGYAKMGDKNQTEKFMQLANEAGDAITKTEDREYFFSELGTISG
jgi:hypothetical protein